MGDTDNLEPAIPDDGLLFLDYEEGFEAHARFFSAAYLNNENMPTIIMHPDQIEVDPQLSIFLYSLMDLC